MRRDPLSFLLGMALGIIFVGVLALYVIDIHAVTVDEVCNEREIEIFPDPVTIVEITTLPHYISGLAEGEPEEIPQTIVYVKPAEGTLSAAAGRVNGPTNEETWYNLNMTLCCVCNNLAALLLCVEVWAIRLVGVVPAIYAVGTP